MFKVAEPYTAGRTTLTLDGVYQIGTMRADHGRNVRVFDLAALRMRGATFTYHNVIAVPVEAAMQIKVYNPLDLLRATWPA